MKKIPLENKKQNAQQALISKYNKQPAEQLPPKIEFPCADYPIKVIGHNIEGFTDYVVSVMQSYDDTLDLQRITHQDSKNGKFRSVRLFMTAQSEKQLMDLNKELKDSGKVVTVL